MNEGGRKRRQGRTVKITVSVKWCRCTGVQVEKKRSSVRDFDMTEFEYDVQLEDRRVGFTDAIITLGEFQLLLMVIRMSH